MPLLSRLRNLFRNRLVTRELEEELSSHLEEALREGRDPEDVRRAFGPRWRLREESRDLRIIPWLDSLRADAVFGWRQIRKRRIASSAAILSLALGMGACVSAFRLIDALFLRPLPIAHAERLLVFARQGMDPGGHFRVTESCEYPLFRQLRSAVKDQAELIAISYAVRRDLTYGSDADMERAYVQFVSGSMFRVFGLTPALGRLLTESDDIAPMAHPYAVLSHEYWTRRFGADPRILGKTLRLGNTSFQIVGVAPAPFTGVETGTMVDIFVPTMMHPGVAHADWSWFRTFVLPKRGIVSQTLLARMQPPFQAIQQETARNLTGMPAQRIREFLDQRLLLEGASSGVSEIQKEYRSALLALGVLVAMVLLIACVNVANLMSVQASARAHEMALRVSIGAGRRRLLQLALVEGAMLAFLAAAMGACFALWAAPFVVSRINPPDDPMRLALPADWRVLAFAAVLSVAATLLFGLAPALRASAVRPASALKGGEDPRRKGRTMHALIAVQVAFCFIVLFGAGLFVATFRQLAHQPTGFSAERLLALDTVTSRPELPVLWAQVAEQVRLFPGVEEVAQAAWPLFSRNGRRGFVWIGGEPASNTLAYFLGISPGWLDIMKIPILAGRDFRVDDTFPGVAIVNEAFARDYLGGENPVGRWFEKPEDGGRHLRLQIVGMTRDARYRDMREPITPTAYVPLNSVDAAGVPELRASGTIFVRTRSLNPLAVAPALRREVRRARPEFRVSNVVTQEELNRSQTIRERLLAMLALFFSGVAVLLAGIGLYGVLDYSVLQRRREIGVRIALGARPSEIVRSVTTEVLVMVAAGAIAGLMLSLASARYVQSLLYEVKATDAVMLAAPALTLLAAAIVAAAPPVIRALRIDPARMLREE